MAVPERLGLGRFVLATNDLSLTPSEMLSCLVSRPAPGKSARHLHSGGLRLPESFLAGPGRLQGLMCFTALVMLVSSALEERLSEGLKASGMALRDKSGNPVERPSLQYAFQKLKGVSGWLLHDRATDERLFRLSVRSPEEKLPLIGLFGKKAAEAYNVSEVNISKERMASIIRSVKACDV
jgi:hypothetical protein